MPELIDISAMNFSLKKKKILQDITLAVYEGEILGIAGESGCGKTTLAKIIAGLFKPDTGSIKYLYPELSKRKGIQLLFQNTGMIINPYRKVENMIYEALELGGENNTGRFNEITDLLRINRRLFKSRGWQLSGGERQRVALARIIAIKPKVVILDEPFSSQDPESKNSLVGLLSDIRKKMGLTLIVISHEISLFENFADRILIMREGKIVEEGKASKTIYDAHDDYTKFLIKAENFGLTPKDII